MTVTATLVKELREKTGAGMLDAKNALVEANGDIDKATELLRQKGMATAEKKSGRTTAEGQVFALIENGKHGTLIEVNCETDFVAKGDAFKALVEQLAQRVLKATPADLEAFLTPEIQTLLTESIGQIKENITVRRLVRYQLNAPGWINAYIHTGGKIGVLLELQTGKDATVQAPEFIQLAKDLSMHIASSAPEFVQRSEIPAHVIEEETRVEMGKEDLQNKPVEIRQKIVAGRVDKLMAQRVFLEQPFVKDPSQTIDELVKALSGKLGDTVSVKRFSRFVLGEGIEKKQANFAEEVMAQLRG